MSIPLMNENTDLSSAQASLRAQRRNPEQQAMGLLTAFLDCFTSFAMTARRRFKESSPLKLNMNKSKRAVFALMLGIMGGSSGISWAEPVQAGSMEIRQPWARILAGSTVGAVYLTLVQKGAQADVLESASCPEATSVELHGHLHENGVMKMRPLKGGLEVKPHEETKLSPGGFHIMLMGVKARGLRTVSLTLKFKEAGSIDITCPVRDSAP